MLDVKDEKTFERITNSKTPVFVKFWAEWCAICTLMSPIMKKLEKRYKGKIEIANVNVDDHLDFATKHNITSIPTVLFFKNGQMIDKSVGLATLEYFDDKVQNVSRGMPNFIGT